MSVDNGDNQGVLYYLDGLVRQRLARYPPLGLEDRFNYVARFSVPLISKRSAS